MSIKDAVNPSKKVINESSLKVKFYYPQSDKDKY